MRTTQGQVAASSLLLVCLAGCAGSPATKLNSAPPHPPPSPAQVKLTTYDAFGDSFTGGGADHLGFNCKQDSDCYAQRIAAQLNIGTCAPAEGSCGVHGVSASGAADQPNRIYHFNVPSDPSRLITYMVGTNDAPRYTTQTQIHQWAQMESCNLAFLAIPTSAKILGQGSSVTTKGAWSPSAYYGGAIGIQSNTNGSTFSFSASGPTVYLCMTVADYNAGTFTLSVDGSEYGAFQAYSPAGSPIKSALGSTHGSFLFSLSGLSAGSHLITGEVTSPTEASAVVEFDWAASPSLVQHSHAPLVVAVGVLRNLRTADSRTQAFSAVKEQVVSDLARDGLNVRYVDVAASVNTTSDLWTDGVHPWDDGCVDHCGHKHLADAILSVVPQ